MPRRKVRDTLATDGISKNNIGFFPDHLGLQPSNQNQKEMDCETMGVKRFIPGDELSFVRLL